MAFAKVTLPGPVDRLMETLARAAAPCALFAMGVTLALRPLKRVPREMAPLAAVKLVLHPLTAWIVLSWIGNFDPAWVWSAVLLASLPTATNVFVIAQQYQVWVERASASILVTTVLSVLSVTGLLYLIKGGYLAADLFP
jgi:predicted permease